MPATYKGLTVPTATDLADGPTAFRQFADTLPASDALGAVNAGVTTRSFTTKAALDAWDAPVGAVGWAEGIMWLRIQPAAARVWCPYQLAGSHLLGGAAQTTQVITFKYPFTSVLDPTLSVTLIPSDIVAMYEVNNGLTGFTVRRTTAGAAGGFWWLATYTHQQEP